jgi:hypothetical protein
LHGNDIRRTVWRLHARARNAAMQQGKAGTHDSGGHVKTSLQFGNVAQGNDSGRGLLLHYLIVIITAR